MQRRPLHTGTLVNALALVAVAGALGPAGVPVPASAQERPAGAVTVLALLGSTRNAPDGGAAVGAQPPADYGAGALADLFYQTGALRFGGALGLAAVSSADGSRSRVYLPLAASASALLPFGTGIGLDLRARAGLWAGATDTGLDADFFGSFGGWLTFGIGAGASVAFGLDVWLQRAAPQPGTRDLELYFSPGLGLLWASHTDSEPDVAPDARARGDD